MSSYDYVRLEDDQVTHRRGTIDTTACGLFFQKRHVTSNGRTDYLCLACYPQLDYAGFCERTKPRGGQRPENQECL